LIDPGRRPQRQQRPELIAPSTPLPASRRGRGT
jgi:hypothetical protein